MTHPKPSKRVLFALITLIAAAFSTASIHAGPLDAAVGKTLPADNDNDIGISSLDYIFTPYGWMAGLDGTAGVGGNTADIDVDFGDVWNSLDFVWAHTLEIRKDRWALFTDFMYLDLKPTFATPGPAFSSAVLDINQLMLGLTPSYRLIDNGKTTVDVMGGTRYMYVEEELILNQGIARRITRGSSEGWWDGVFAVKARHQLNDKWFLNFYGDIGGGQSDGTWQLLGAVGYQLCERAHLVAGYRILSVDYENDGFVYDLDTKGPLLGLRIEF